MPPNATDYLQPLDVSFFAPFKRTWRKLLTEYKEAHLGASGLKKDHFPQLLKLLFEDVLPGTKETLINGFNRCFSRPTILGSVLPVRENVDSVISQVLLETLKEKRFGRAKIQSRKRTRLEVSPGRCIGNEESSEEEDDEDEEEEEEEYEEEEEEEEVDDEDQNHEQDIENGEENRQEVQEMEDEAELGFKRWVVAKFLIGRGFRYYVAAFLERNGDYFAVSCLRKKKKGIFIFPKRKDEAYIREDQVVMELPEPDETAENGLFLFKFPSELFDKFPIS